MKVLVINAGGSSLKYQLIDMNTHQALAKGICERIGIDGSRLKHTPHDQEKILIESPMKDHTDALELVISALTSPEHGVIKDMSEISAVGHRVVHGGEFFSGSVIIDDKVKKCIEDCAELAPLHNRANLIGINACEKIVPGAPQVAVFDTAFHQTMPKEAYLYAIPYEYYEKYKIRRYGFHGTSHKFVSARAAEMLGKPIEELKLITLHLGNGSSITAVDHGKSVDTTMGFTPLAGLPMGTRSGDIDPAIIPYIMEKENLSPADVSEMLNKRSGILAVSRTTSDFRDLEFTYDTSELAKLALDYYDYAIKKYVGQYMAVMNGVDALIFTAGVGENNPMLRSHLAKSLSWFGVKIDEEKNDIRGIERDITAPGAKIKSLVIPTNEEYMIALETQALVNA